MPEDIQRILKYVADYAKSYDSHMKWNEGAKLKSDMMLRMDRWRLVTTEEIEDECRALGMREEDVRAIRDMYAKRMRGLASSPRGAMEALSLSMATG